MTLEIAKKYSIDSIFKHVQKDLLAHHSLRSDPLRVFAIATRFRLDNVAREAAQATLYRFHWPGKVLWISYTYPHWRSITFTTTILDVRKLYEISLRVFQWRWLLACYLRKIIEGSTPIGAEYFVNGSGGHQRPSIPSLWLLQGIQKSISLDKCSRYGYERLHTVSQYLANGP